LTVYGSNFLPTSALNFGGMPEPTTIISASELTASIPASAIATTGTASVTVNSPGPGGGASNAVNFAVSPGGGIHPTPAIGTLSPTGVSAGGPGFTLTITDSSSSYVDGSFVRWNGTDRPTTFVAANEITAQIPASDSSTPGTASITVFNPPPGGGLSSAALLTIVEGGLGPVSVTILPDPSHKFAKYVYVANRSSDNISIYQADATTGLLKFSGSAVTGHLPTSVIVDPSGKFLYAANSGSGTISMYTLDETTGLLTSIGEVVAGSGPVFVTVHPSGSVSQYSINPAFNGELSFSGTIGAGYCSDGIAVDPSEKFAYVINSLDNDISMYKIDSSTGLFSSIGLVAARTSPSSIAIDPSGKFVYVTNFNSNDVSIYNIDAATGSLAFIGTISS
jgi:DNA-binding beta-propeller fold protein YncE